MTYQTEMIKYKVPRAFVEISPELAQSRDIHEGAEIKLISETGEASLLAHITLNNDALENGDLDNILDRYAFLQTNTCTNGSCDERGKSPLNPTNFRVNKQRQPQYSVQVQKMGALRLCIPRKDE